MKIDNLPDLQKEVIIVGFWKKIQDLGDPEKVAERVKKSEDSLKRIREANERAREANREAKAKRMEPPAGNPNDNQSRERERIKALISDYKALDNLSEDELEHLRLTSESTLEKCERDFTAEEKDMLRQLNTPEMQVELSTPIIGSLIRAMIPEAKVREKQEQIDDLKLLLKLIANKQKAKPQPEPEPAQKPQQPTRAEKRAASQKRLADLQRDKADDLDQMAKNGSDEESIKRRANMWDDAIRREEEELRKYL
jgi:hypothetical protein